MSASSGLPITINADQALMESLGLTRTMLEKLEAWANFSTLKANWYGDPKIVLSIKITLVSAEFFSTNLADQKTDKWQVDKINHTALSSNERLTHHSVFMALSEISNQQSNAQWVESATQAQLQKQLLTLLNQLSSILKLDAIAE